jgi:hypothetical protein
LELEDLRDDSNPKSSASQFAIFAIGEGERKPIFILKKNNPKMNNNGMTNASQLSMDILNTYRLKWPEEAFWQIFYGEYFTECHRPMTFRWWA